MVAPLALDLRELTIERDGFALRVPELRLPAGAAAALVGPSGAGKSTLLLGMLGLLPDAKVAGRAEVAGVDLVQAAPAARRDCLRRHLALVLQDARAAADPLCRLGDQLGTWTGASAQACTTAAAELGLTDGQLARFPHQVSGGEAQRVLLAAALLRQPSLLIADEPTASLDPAAVTGFLERLQALRARTGAALLVSTHDRELVERLGAQPFAVDDGCVAAGLPPDVAWQRRAPGAGIGEPLLHAERVAFRHGPRELFRDLDLTLRRGEVLAVTGPSGCGKTTLAHLLCGRLQPSAGRIVRPPRASAIQMLPQDAAASLTPGRTIASLLAETAVTGFDVVATAAALGLSPELLGRSVERLSGGERRRAALLRALSVGPDVLILDEPTASLDARTGAAVIATLLDLMRQHALGILLVTHDHRLAAAIADRRLELGAGA